MTGRGSWNIMGLGGTLSYPDGAKAGPYFVLASGSMKKVGSAGWDSPDVNERAVHGGVLAIQRALRRRGFFLDVNGIFDAPTKKAVTEFQTTLEGVTPWGGVGFDTSRALFADDLAATEHPAAIPLSVVCGTVWQESTWDPAAVGTVDDTDLGLGQLNGASNPDLTERERLLVKTTFNAIVSRLAGALKELGQLDDAIAAYNLGIGGKNSDGVWVGARAWIRDGRPDVWTPPGSSTPRNVRERIELIKSLCA